MLNLSGVTHPSDDGSNNQQEECLDGANSRYGGHTANLSGGLAGLENSTGVAITQ
jgi:predicted transcriptional regulator with HTH domain